MHPEKVQRPPNELGRHPLTTGAVRAPPLDHDVAAALTQALNHEGSQFRQRATDSGVGREHQDAEPGHGVLPRPTWSGHNRSSAGGAPLEADPARYS